MIEIHDTDSEEQLRALRAELARDFRTEHHAMHVAVHHADGQEKHFFTDAARFLDRRIAAAVERRRTAELADEDLVG